MELWLMALPLDQLGYIEDEIGDYGFFNENFDNHETLTLMSQVRKIIAQANGGK